VDNSISVCSDHIIQYLLDVTSKMYPITAFLIYNRYYPILYKSVIYLHVYLCKASRAEMPVNCYSHV